MPASQRKCMAGGELPAVIPSALGLEHRRELLTQTYPWVVYMETWGRAWSADDEGQEQALELS